MMNYLFKKLAFVISLCLLTLSGVGVAQDDSTPELLEKATAYVQQSQYEKAIEIYTFYLGFQPNHVDARSQRAVAFASIGNFENAFEDINKAFESAGFAAIEQAIVHNNRAQINFLSNEPESALDDFSRAIELNPNYADYWLNRGILNQYMGNWDNALADYEAYLNFNPEDSEAYLSMAQIYLTLGDLTNTLSSLDSAIEITPEDAELYIFRGSIYLQVEQFADAAKDYADWLRLINTIEYNAEALTNETNQYIAEMAYGALHRIPFEANSGDRFGLSANSRFVDSLVVLLDPDGNPIMANDDGGQGLNSFILDFTLPQDGTYTLLVGHARGGWEGDIEVTIQIVPAEGI